MKQKLVVVGNGMAGIRCVEEILKHSSDVYEISIIGSETHLNYNRILLSSVLQGEAKFEDITLNHSEWYSGNKIDLYSGETVINIDSTQKHVLTDKNRLLSYDKLILATGSSPFVLPVPGVEKEGVITFRTIEDCKKMIETTKNQRAIVIGGGVLGLEAAWGLLHLGLDVSVVHNSECLMQRQLDQASSQLLQKQLERKGIKFLLGKTTKEFNGENKVEEIVFTDDSSVSADLVVMSVGVMPNVQLAKDSGIKTNRGIVVNDFMETSVKDIYAVGECVEHNGFVYGLVKPLYEQGKVLANRLCSTKSKRYKGSVLSTSLKVPGIDLFSIGDLREDESTQALTILNEINEVYKKMIFRGDIMVGAVLYGDTKSQSKLADVIMKRKHINDVEKQQLMYSTEKDYSLLSSMKVSEVICNCNGVSKGAIMEAVQHEGISTLDEVKQCTKASNSCGSCKSLVCDLLEYIHSDDCDEVTEKKTLCACTALTEDEVVYEIQQQNLSSVGEVIAKLNWFSKDGCSKCIPAISYYLAMIYPKAEAANTSSFENQGLLLSSQKDGTYSLTPRIYGGRISAQELKKIANAIEKYQLSYVGLTSAQNIQIKGIKKEYVQAVCAELNMSFHSLENNTVQHINTLFGEHACTCDYDDAMQLAIDLEKGMETIITPYKVILSVSACKHSNADNIQKDINIIGDDRGWEIYVGGQILSPDQQEELLTIAQDVVEVKQVVLGLIQYYRETANYLECIFDWIERVGLIHIREVLFEDSLRMQLVERLEVEVEQTLSF
ncbi:nitrite reductase (NADH) large subunit [Metabacillus crassostreae]|uniref:nitrite reductase large subunit NirB n=1 Tax=Metabacillus crassostreae TaxID=929098 RepID=UPI001956691F|nr:nitrite reductase large subunit NirB [Metabacillus crassostreae]MBM7605209.1 nitrite reductase (NADH) large subunit [Metabacillus crassostreae]